MKRHGLKQQTWSFSFFSKPMLNFNSNKKLKFCISVFNLVHVGQTRSFDFFSLFIYCKSKIGRHSFFESFYGKLVFIKCFFNKHHTHYHHQNLSRLYLYHHNFHHCFSKSPPTQFQVLQFFLQNSDNRRV